MLLDINYLFGAPLELPKGAFLFQKVLLKPLPCVVISELFKELKTENIQIDLLKNFIENDELEDWKRLKKEVDPISTWTYKMLVYSLVQGKKGWLDGLIVQRQLVKLLKVYSKDELFIGLAKLNGLLLYLDSNFGEKSKDKEDDYSLKPAKRHLDVFNALIKLGIQGITVGDYLTKLSYLQVEAYIRLAMVKELNDFALNAPMGLTEEGREKLDKDIDKIKKFNCERSYVYNHGTPIWHAYFSEEALKSPYLKERQEQLRLRCGEDNMIYRQYLKDKDGFIGRSV